MFIKAIVMFSPSTLFEKNCLNVIYVSNVYWIVKCVCQPSRVKSGIMYLSCSSDYTWSAGIFKVPYLAGYLVYVKQRQNGITQVPLSNIFFQSIF